MEKQFILSPRALELINGALENLSQIGCETENLVLNVSPSSDIASQSSVTTDYGILDIIVNPHVYKGLSYIVGKHGYGGYIVVSRPKVPTKC